MPTKSRPAASKKPPAKASRCWPGNDAAPGKKPAPKTAVKKK